MKIKKISKKEKAEKGAGWIIGIILVSIILVAAILFVRQKFFGPTFEYKGYDVSRVNFEGSDPYYSLKAPIRIYGFTNLYFITLNNDPRTLEDIEVEENTRDALLAPKPTQIYLTFDPDMSNKGHIAVATTEIARVLGRNGPFNLKLNGAVTKSVSGLEDRVAACDDSGERTLVIEFKYGEETEIYVDENYERCVIVQGTNEKELIEAADKTVLTILGL